MRCNGHQFAQCAGRQAGVAVQREHIANVVCQPKRGGERQKAVHVAGCQQAQQLLQLAAFALPAQPALLGFTPAARPVNEQKTRWAARWCRIACIQCRQPGQSILQQTGVARLYGAGRIDPVGQQGKLGLVFAVGQPVKFKLLDQRLAGRRRSQQRWNDDQNAVLGRNAPREIKARQGPHLERLGHQAMHKGRSRLRGGPGHQENSQQGLPSVPFGMVRCHPQHQQRRQGDDGDVDRQSPLAPVDALHRTFRWHAQRAFKLAPAIAHQVIACSALYGVGAHAVRHILGGSDNRLCGFAFCFLAAPRQLFHGAGDLLAREFAFLAKTGQLPQHLQRQADRLDQIHPVHLADHAQRGDDVANRLVGRHLRVLAFQHQCMAVGAMLFDPLH